jgi:hypothetical protein
VAIGTTFILSGVEHSPEKIAVMKEAGTYELTCTAKHTCNYTLCSLGCIVFRGLFIWLRFLNLIPTISLQKQQGKWPFVQIPFLQGVLAPVLLCGSTGRNMGFFIQYI